MTILPLFTMGPLEWVIIGVVVLLVLGPTQIPKLAKMFGKASKKFKEGLENDDEEKEEKKSSVKKASADDADEA